MFASSRESIAFRVAAASGEHARLSALSQSRPDIINSQAVDGNTALL